MRSTLWLSRASSPTSHCRRIPPPKQSGSLEQMQSVAWMEVWHRMCFQGQRHTCAEPPRTTNPVGHTTHVDQKFAHRRGAERPIDAPHNLCNGAGYSKHPRRCTFTHKENEIQHRHPRGLGCCEGRATLTSTTRPPRPRAGPCSGCAGAATGADVGATAAGASAGEARAAAWRACALLLRASIAHLRAAQYPRCASSRGPQRGVRAGQSFPQWVPTGPHEVDDGGREGCRPNLKPGSRPLRAWIRGENRCN